MIIDCYMSLLLSRSLLTKIKSVLAQLNPCEGIMGYLECRGVKIKKSEVYLDDLLTLISTRHAIFS